MTLPLRRIPVESPEDWGESNIPTELPAPPEKRSTLPPPIPASHLSRAHAAKPAWSVAEMAGRIAELSSSEASGVLTLAMALVLQAQRKGEAAAWITSPQSTFFPPDAAEGGVDLSALAVVRVPDTHASARAADRLVRSGAFALVVLDLGTAGEISQPLLSRLLGVAQKHGTGLLCLTEQNSRAPLSGSLVSFRGTAARLRTGDDRFTCTVRAEKDKRRAAGWAASETFRGPVGLR